MSRPIDEDGPPGTPGEIRTVASDTPDEVIEFRMPLRLPFRQGRRQVLVVRAHTATAQVTVAIEGSR